ncbi:MAG: hypothetical protein KJO07_08895 [Deltaproteobacteria bacterium]|nr:hypothetical protein [Deltaproteobacteria bacterium]
MRWIVRLGLLFVLAAGGCYGRADATRDTNLEWRGRSKRALVDDWGKPAQVLRENRGEVMRYSFNTRRITLPTFRGFLVARPGFVAGEAVFKPGTITRYRHDVLVAVDPGERIVDVTGPSLRWGPPDDANMRWSFLFGFHAGMSTLDDTATPLPGGGLYIGGMLSRVLGLVGTFSMAAGSDDEGGAMAFAWGLAPQYWLHTRVWVRAGPAMVLAFDPGFENVGLEPGVSAAASYALVRSDTFVFDLRFDLNAGLDTVFGVVGLGVNVN